MTPIVFVHGFLGGSRQWAGQSGVFCETDDITVDLPGFGENCHLMELDSIAAYAKWVLDALKSREITLFHLVGHSMGGMVAQEIMVQSPERVESLVLYGTGSTGVLPGRFETISTSKRRACADGSQVTARRIAATWFLKTTEAKAYEDCAAIAEKSSLQAILAGLDAMQNWSGTDRLHDIRARTLVLWGDQDRTYPWSQTECLWRSIPGADLAVIPDCAHAAHLEQPMFFNSIIKGFFSSIAVVTSRDRWAERQTDGPEAGRRPEIPDAPKIDQKTADIPK